MKVNRSSLVIASVAAVIAVVVGGCSADASDDILVFAQNPTERAGLAMFGGNCSGSVVATESSVRSDPALLLTNGHCDFTDAVLGQPNADQPTRQSATISTGEGRPAVAVDLARRLYWTMTGTDVALYRMDQTYGELADHGIAPFRMSDRQVPNGTPVTIGTSAQAYECTVARTAASVLEVGQQTRDVLAYESGCQAGPGTSGAPVLDAEASVVGIHNSSNSSGGQCTRNEPCEMDREGVISVHEGVGYAPPIRGLVDCLDGAELDLTRQGCTVPKP